MDVAGFMRHHPWAAGCVLNLLSSSGLIYASNFEAFVPRIRNGSSCASQIETKYMRVVFRSINQSIFISGSYTYMLLDMLTFDHSEQSMDLDSRRQAYFHDTPNILSVENNVKNLSQEYNIYAIYTDGNSTKLKTQELCRFFH